MLLGLGLCDVDFVLEHCSPRVVLVDAIELSATVKPSTAPSARKRTVIYKPVI